MIIFTIKKYKNTEKATLYYLEKIKSTIKIAKKKYKCIIQHIKPNEQFECLQSPLTSTLTDEEYRLLNYKLELLTTIVFDQDEE